MLETLVIAVFGAATSYIIGKIEHIDARMDTLEKALLEMSFKLPKRNTD